MKTFGWDTVFIVNTDRINTMLAEKGDQTTLLFDTTLPNLPIWQTNGKFASWQITDGGSNEIIHLKLTISSGVLTDGTTSYNLQGLTLVIATYLHWLEYAENQQSLQFDYNKLGNLGNPPNRGELSVIALRDPNEILPPEYNALLAYSLGEYLVVNADKVRFVFATINLIPPTTNSWLTPKKSAYGYFRKEGSDRTFLAILSVTADKDIHNLQRTVDPNALPTATNASFIIADSLYLLNVIGVSLARIFNVDVNAFRYDSDGHVLRNTQRLWTKPVKSGAIWYDPWIDNLEIRSGEGALQGRYQGGVDLKAGISMTYTIDARNDAQYHTDTGALGFNRDPSPHESHDADIPWYWFFLGPIVIAIVEIVVKIISDDIAAQISDDNRERLAFGKYPPSSILWNGESKIQVTSVGINDAMYIFGNV